MKITKKRKEKYMEQIITLLELKQVPLWTLDISNEIGRDDEYVMKLMKELRNKGKVCEIRGNEKGIKYLQRRKWKIK